MNNRFGLLAFVAILATACAPSDHQLSIKPQKDNLPLVIVQAGGRSFNVPVVNGFHDLKSVSSKMFDQLEREVLESHRVLVLLVDNNDRTRAMGGEDLELESSISLSVQRKFEYSIIYEDKFEILRRVIKEKFESLPSEILEVTEKGLEEGTKIVEEEMGLVVQAEVTGPPVSLGIFLDSKDSVGGIYKINMSFEFPDTSIEVSEITAKSIVRVNNRILDINVSSTYENDETIEWCKRVSREWINAILAAN